LKLSLCQTRRYNFLRFYLNYEELKLSDFIWLKCTNLSFYLNYEELKPPNPISNLFKGKVFILTMRN